MYFEEEGELLMCRCVDVGCVEKRYLDSLIIHCRIGSEEIHDTYVFAIHSQLKNEWERETKERERENEGS